MHHTRTLYKITDINRARLNLERHEWARQILEKLKSAVQPIIERDANYLETMIPATTPGSLGFTNCAACGANAIHGSYHWDPLRPDELVCTTCKQRYPDEKYPEDVAFVAERHGGGQRITFHSGHSCEFQGFHLYSSWSALMRARKVEYMANQVLALAQIFALTDEQVYGALGRDILKRFATVYPGYLVHSSYGEWIDLPPNLVAQRINDLPEDEWTIPPNKPDRRLHSGYFNSGRATGYGMEGTFIRQATIAYDLLYPLFTTEERSMVEENLLREGTTLLIADQALNNKSVGNLTAAGFIGLVLRDPRLVRTGIRGFKHFVDKWFLYDGTASESPTYGLMTLDGLREFGEAVHGYSDPHDYQADDRLEFYDTYGEAKYKAIFSALYETLLPNLNYPAWADSFVNLPAGSPNLELMATRLDDSKYRTLLAASLATKHEAEVTADALWLRDPQFSPTTCGTLSFKRPFFSRSAHRLSALG